MRLAKWIPENRDVCVCGCLFVFCLLVFFLREGGGVDGKAKSESMRLRLLQVEQRKEAKAFAVYRWSSDTDSLKGK